jgi:hypothetical protein
VPLDWQMFVLGGGGSAGICFDGPSFAKVAGRIEGEDRVISWLALEGSSRLLQLNRLTTL